MPKLPDIARNPLAFVAARWTPAPATVRRATLSALVMSVVIVVTGGAVRLTGSGLGCPTAPRCVGDSWVPTGAMGVHGAIEFGNRMLTYVLCAAVGWAIVAVRSQKPYRRGLTRLGWAQFWLVVANAVLGAFTVLTGLNPYTVCVHFLLAFALIVIAVLMWQRTAEGDAPPRPLVGKPVRQLGAVLTAATVALIAAGTVVTGAGPHAGDSSDVHRIPVDWKSVAQLHADLAWVVVALTVALWFVLRAVDAPAGPRQRVRDLFLVLMSQGVIGYVQYFTHLPEAVVGLHMFGACLVWVSTLRVLLSFRERPLTGPGDPGPGAPSEAQEAAGPAVGEPRVRETAAAGGREGARAARTGESGDPLPVRR
ncbi:COX15/CtaA family protein [Actinacidiphila sp. ITFR-21]|uniref:COX15/CtaA family protein n=1 Tax=Actinacidiphila sp. ITFR-21 TaxID=3075199 RepID=UPI0028890604|nr:COX15/CtaA family protein [Streptomyces sp. ITFR-21]WNI15023.1 COX15/CtaA family protein [Streptomyces sp. ITFR-21]